MNVMANTTNSSERSQKKRANYGGFSFVIVRLSATDKDWLASANCADEFPITQVFDLAQEGYKFSLKEDTKNNTFIASLADIREKSPTEKKILSGRGSTANNAWYALAYRHNILCQGDWSGFTEDEANSDFD